MVFTTKTQRPIVFVTFRYSLFDDTSTAATVDVTTGGVLLQPCAARENIETKKLQLCAARGSMETNKKYFASYSVDTLCLSLQPWLRQWEYRHRGCSIMSQCISEFLVAHSKSKKTSPF